MVPQSVYWNSVLGRFVIFDTGISGSGSKTQSDKGWFVLAIRKRGGAPRNLQQVGIVIPIYSTSIVSLMPIHI